MVNKSSSLREDKYEGRGWFTNLREDGSVVEERMVTRGPGKQSVGHKPSGWAEAQLGRQLGGKV